MAKREPLGVWLHGVRVADLTSSRPGEVVSRYSDAALDRWPNNIPLLSCSLPLSRGRSDASVFFSGLLPEGQHRQAMAAEARVPAYDTFGLLERFGRDVAGALVIGRDDPGARPGGVELYTPDSLAAEVGGLDERPLGLHDDSELSIAGLQDKLLLIDLGRGRWGRPVHGRPSTHILKVEDRRFAGMAEAEAACLHLARAVRLTSVDASVARIADLPCLIVSRFDRSMAAKHVVTRVHQEDACQALRRNPEAAHGRGKYEAAGGPSLREIAAVLDRFAVDGEEQLLRLVAVTTFNVLIGNADAHGKNIGLLHPTADSVELAPLYDTVPTSLWPKLRRDGAMTVGARVRLASITPKDIVTEAEAWRLSPSAVSERALSTAEQMLEYVQTGTLYEPVRDFVRERATTFLSAR
jgi:serine/threonine-protein kinase HipA